MEAEVQGSRGLKQGKETLVSSMHRQSYVVPEIEFGDYMIQMGSGVKMSNNLEIWKMISIEIFTLLNR